MASVFNFVQSIDASAFNYQVGAGEAEASVVMIVTIPRAPVTYLWLLVMVVQVAI